MKEMFIPFRNWRIHVLAILGTITLLLLSGETADLCSFVIIKSIGFALAYVILRLGKY